MSPAEARLKEVPSGMTEAEWGQRVNLAACYRLIAHYGWDDLVDTHISARVPGPEHHFLINPYGLMFDEITASSLVKVDLDGNLLTKGPYSINPAGFTIHSASVMPDGTSCRRASAGDMSDFSREWLFFDRETRPAPGLQQDAGLDWQVCPVGLYGAGIDSRLEMLRPRMS